MSNPDGSVSARKELADLAARRDALRQTAALEGANLRPTLDAALGRRTRRPWTRCTPNAGCCARSSMRRRWR